VHLDGLHCLLAHFPGLICHYLVSKIIIKKNKFFFLKIIFFILFFIISYNFILHFTCKCYFVISVSGLVFACIYVVVIYYTI
jgi:hypothetical protein